jgi:hypothetical protein
MRRLLICAAVAVLAAPSFAQEGAPASDTLKEVTAKGIVLDVQGFLIDVAYNPDGTLAVTIPGVETPFPGKWRIDGDKLCTSSDVQPEECVPYPLGKKSGDSFEVTSSQGTAIVKIK